MRSFPHRAEFPLVEVSIKTEFYVATEWAPAEERTRVLKYGRMFAVFDPYGDIRPSGLGEHGIYYRGTRFLSRLAVSLGAKPPLFLSSGVRADNSLFTADLTNVDFLHGDNVVLARGTIHLVRSKLLLGNTCYEQLRITNYAPSSVRLPIQIHFAADFVDVFEVRGVKRSRRGERLPDLVQEESVTLRYRGLDNVMRCTQLHCSPVPADLSASHIVFDASLKPRETAKFQLSITCGDDLPDHPPDTFDGALALAVQDAAEIRNGNCAVHSSNDQFNSWLNRSLSDLNMMTVGNPEADYPYAGVPWFSTVFGRDGIITALETLWLDPRIAKGVLQYLAETQARENFPEAEADPGKIVHETREGEMAMLGEVPFSRYYGSVDSTPLFVMLAGAYYQRTADLDFVRTLWPHVQQALEWIDNYGDLDGDGFVEYQRRSAKGLIQQGWKDSSDSVFHADGSLAEPPIALCEVQGYVYAAKKQAAVLARALSNPAMAASLDDQAEQLQSAFEKAFWCEDLSIYALALDSRKRQCRVRASNAGHCLYTGIATQSKAERTAQILLGADFFSGWGVRTISSSERRYNPLSYHNGSVWPHDNALLASGLGRYGLTREAALLLAAIFEASTFFELNRLPELLCGLHKRAGEGPTLYPVACSPQAWSAAAPFMLLSASVGLSMNAHERCIALNRPSLPESVPMVVIEGLRLRDASVDLAFERKGQDVRVEVMNKSGLVDVIVRQ
jgi:glycogen debranching enzyme